MAVLVVVGREEEVVLVVVGRVEEVLVVDWGGRRWCCW